MIRRLAAVGVAGTGFVLITPSVALAHGIGGRLDLPVPVSYFVVAAGVVLVVSFVALAVLWPEARLQDGPKSGKVFGRTRTLATVLRFLGLAGLFLVVAQVIPPLFGAETVQGRQTIAPVTVWVLMWLVVPFGSALVGNWYSAINPWSTLGDLLEDRNRVESKTPNGLPGVGPATLLLIGFTWLELVSPSSSDPAQLGWAALIYTSVVLVAVRSIGKDRALVTFEFFTTYNRMFSAISPIGRNSEGRLFWRGWLRALPALPEWPEFPFFVLAAIGTVSYDGASGTRWFRDFTGFFGARTIGKTTLLLAFVVAVAGAYWLASWVAARMVGNTTASRVASRFAHTLVPIALAYAVAHYFTLIIFEGQQLLSAVSDPFGLGWDLFGTADRSVDFFLTASEPIWYLQLAFIVTGHILGVVLAHDRALADFGKEAVRSQYAMLLLMVGLTSLGLVILAG